MKGDRGVLEVAEGVWILSGWPRHAVNVYLLGDVLVDSGIRGTGRRLLRQLAGRKVSRHVLTHVHPDHQGSSLQLSRALNVPIDCGAADVDAANDPALMLARLGNHWVNRWVAPRVSGPGFPIERALRQGNRLGEFEVIETPGHTAGHISLWRPADRLLLLGDALANINWKTWKPGLHEPPAYFSTDRLQNRRSVVKAAELEPEVVCFGHGPPLRNPEGFRRVGALLRSWIEAGEPA